MGTEGGETTETSEVRKEFRHWHARLDSICDQIPAAKMEITSSLRLLDGPIETRVSSCSGTLTTARLLFEPKSKVCFWGDAQSSIAPLAEAFTRKGTQLSHHELWTFTTTRTETERKRARGTSKRSRTKSSIKNTDSFPEYDFKCTLAFSELTTKRKRVLNPGR